jgi:hypothetical protein
LAQRLGFSAARSVLSYVRDNANVLFICTTAPSSFSAASNQPQKIVSANVSSDDFSIVSGVEGPRFVLKSKTVTIEGSGSASHAVLAKSSGSTILATTDVCGSVVLTSGNVLVVPAWLNENLAGDKLSYFDDAALDLHFRGTPTLDSRVTFARTSNGHYHDYSGKLILASANVARLDHNPTTLAPRGLLVEETRSNGWLRTQELNFGGLAFNPWGGSGVTIAADVTAAPDGRMTADKVVEDTSNGAHSIQQNVDKPASASSYALSVYAKAGGRTEFIFQCYSIAAPANECQAQFNLSNGTILSSAAVAGTWTAPQQSIIAYPDGWYRCTIGFTTSTETSVATNWYLQAASDPTYQGDGSSGIFMWGFQMEDGKFPTSYIRSEGSPGSRTGDNVLMTGTNFTDWFTSATGTWYSEAEYFATAQATSDLLVASDGTTNNMMRHMVAETTTSVNVSYVSGGSTQASFSSARGTPALVKLASVYTTNDFAGAFNGTLMGTDSSGTVPAVNKLQIGENPSSAKANAWVRRLSYWGSRKTNAFIINVTKP